MSPHTTQPPFGETPQGQPDGQAAPATRPGEAHVSRALAERHEALWLAVSALHKDMVALGAKKPGAPVSDAVRVVAEGLLSDCAPFIRKRSDRLPVAAHDHAGLAVQLGQALAGLEDWENRHSFIDARHDCRMWRVTSGQLPIMRLKPPPAALPTVHRNMDELREKLARRIDGQRAGDFERGFRAGRAARQGKPLAEIEEEFRPSYPRLRLFD